jgi:hypothetical protein
LRSTFYYPNNMIIPISSASQGEQHPLYCIKCWEHQKRVQAEDIDNWKDNEGYLRW